MGRKKDTKDDYLEFLLEDDEKKDVDGLEISSIHLNQDSIYDDLEDLEQQRKEVDSEGVDKTEVISKEETKFHDKDYLVFDFENKNKSESKPKKSDPVSTKNKIKVLTDLTNAIDETTGLNQELKSKADNDMAADSIRKSPSMGSDGKTDSLEKILRAGQLEMEQEAPIEKDKAGINSDQESSAAKNTRTSFDEPTFVVSSNSEASITELNDDESSQFSDSSADEKEVSSDDKSRSSNLADLNVEMKSDSEDHRYQTIVQEKAEKERVKKQSSNEIDIKVSKIEFDPSQVNAEKLTENLSQVENLRIAQDKILDLESEVHRLREDNESLRAAGEVLRIRTEEVAERFEDAKYRKEDVEERFREEIKLSQVRLSSKDKENEQLRVKVEALELRLKRDLQMVRIRERELENRLELVKIEQAAVLRSKDEHILELKRAMDQAEMENDSFKDKARSMQDNIEEKTDKIRRTIRTLRLALNMLDEEVLKEAPSEEKKTG
ncbi:MAG: hypothetical protein AB8E15_09810 [Bdellovibrionales bacterium]